MDKSAAGEQRRALDLHLLRIAAWCVQRDRYAAELPRRDGGHRGRPRTVTLTFYIEAADFTAADRAVREIEATRNSSS